MDKWWKDNNRNRTKEYRAEYRMQKYANDESKYEQQMEGQSVFRKIVGRSISTEDRRQKTVMRSHYLWPRKLQNCTIPVNLDAI